MAHLWGSQNGGWGGAWNGRLSLVHSGKLLTSLGEGHISSFASNVCVTNPRKHQRKRRKRLKEFQETSAHDSRNSF